VSRMHWLTAEFLFNAAIIAVGLLAITLVD
jgi:hypothetical protein